jgi:hypothetical protein
MLFAPLVALLLLVTKFINVDWGNRGTPLSYELYQDTDAVHLYYMLRKMRELIISFTSIKL